MFALPRATIANIRVLSAAVFGLKNCFSHGFSTMAPKKTSQDYLREWREYRAQHGSVPLETSKSAGHALAMRIRKARERGVFNAAELAELDSPTSVPAEAQPKSLASYGFKPASSD